MYIDHSQGRSFPNRKSQSQELMCFLWEMETYGEEGKFKSLEKPFRTFRRNLNFYIMYCHSILPPSIII